MKLHQQGNEIIVTELRPMSDLLDDNLSIIFVEGHISLPARRFGEHVIGVNGWVCSVASCLGWLPMPQYLPELKQTKEDIHNYYGA